jgi:hypothetical protein
MKTVGLFLIRNEVDLIEINLRHHFATAIDEAIVVDNGSSDGTMERVAALAGSFPIRLTSEPGPYDQSARITAMARAAYDDGADWVLPIDADEFWIGIHQPLRSVIAGVAEDVNSLQAEIVNFIQAREVLTASPSCLLSMTMRPVRPVGPIERCEELVESGTIGFVEMMYPPKGVRRTHPDLVILPGNHSVAGAPLGNSILDEVVCMHAPLRARSLLTGKLDQGRRLLEENPERQDSWHVRRWWRLARQGALDDEWAANSHQNESLSVSGTDRELVSDNRLHDAVVDLVPGVEPVVGRVSTALDISVAAFQLAMESVPGKLSWLDVALLERLSDVQRAHGIEGDLLTVGLESVRSAVLFGYLARPDSEGSVVSSGFGPQDSVEGVGPERQSEPHDQETLIRQYDRFHSRVPQLPGRLSGAERDGSCRIIYLSVPAERVRDALGHVGRLLRPGGVVALSIGGVKRDVEQVLSQWEDIVPMRFTPIVMTDDHVYLTWDDEPVARVPWDHEIQQFLAQGDDVELGIRSLAGLRIPVVRGSRHPDGINVASEPVPGRSARLGLVPATSIRAAVRYWRKRSQR